MELFSEAEAEQARQDAVDLLEEEREMTLIRSTIYQQDLRRFHARNVKSRAFQEGDLVLRVDQKQPHKLAPAWEGPFIITKVLHNGERCQEDVRATLVERGSAPPLLYLNTRINEL